MNIISVVTWLCPPWVTGFLASSSKCSSIEAKTHGHTQGVLGSCRTQMPTAGMCFMYQCLCLWLGFLSRLQWRLIWLQCLLLWQLWNWCRITLHMSCLAIPGTVFLYRLTARSLHYKRTQCEKGDFLLPILLQGRIEGLDPRGSKATEHSVYHGRRWKVLPVADMLAANLWDSVAAFCVYFEIL